MSVLSLQWDLQEVQIINYYKREKMQPCCIEIIIEIKKRDETSLENEGDLGGILGAVVLLLLTWAC